MLGRFVHTVTNFSRKPRNQAISLLYLSARPSFTVSVSLSTVPNNVVMPARPYQYRSVEASNLLDLSELGQNQVASEKKRQDAFDMSRKIQIDLTKARDDLEFGSITAKLATLEIEVRTALGLETIGSRKPREANLGNRVEEFVRLSAFNHFLDQGVLLSPSSVSFATDEEYLGGACMGLCQDLSHYGMGRATARDMDSVQAARNLVQELLDFLLKFDFRNGYLRRKYDGTKYALKNLETILYELSVTGASTSKSEDQNEEKVENDPKRQKIESVLAAAKDELEAVRKRMEHRDELRESLIKKSRDGQKAAKQTIYALHRGDIPKAATLLKQCEECIKNDLLPIVNEEPSLRSGSFANVLEEYAEAKLFWIWLVGENGDASEPTGKILGIAEFGIALENSEYLGGICDLTGEIGRYAVQRGTVRDSSGVKACLEANKAIHVALSLMERCPHGIQKKTDQLRRSVEKLERMTYEMSLSEAAGRTVSAEEVPVQGTEE